jgi:myosin heavy subunit
MENVNTRPRRARANSLTSDMFNNSLLNTTMFESSLISLPDMTIEDEDNSKDMKNKLKSLQTELHSAHTEIENLNTETRRLKECLLKQEKQIEMLKKLNSERPNTPKSNTKVKKLSLASVENRLRTQAQFNVSTSEEQTDQQKPQKIDAISDTKKILKKLKHLNDPKKSSTSPNENKEQKKVAKSKQLLKETSSLRKTKNVTTEMKTVEESLKVDAQKPQKSQTLNPLPYRSIMTNPTPSPCIETLLPTECTDEGQPRQEQEGTSPRQVLSTLNDPITSSRIEIPAPAACIERRKQSQEHESTSPRQVISMDQSVGEKNSCHIKDGNYKKMLILSDEYGKSLAGFIKDQCTKYSSITSICKPNAQLKEIAANISNLTQHMNEGDDVVIIASNVKNYRLSYIVNAINHCNYKRLKLQLTTLPYSNKIGINNKIYEINSMVQRLVLRSRGVSLIDINKYRNKYFNGIKGTSVNFKQFLYAKIIHNSHREFTHKHGNLIYLTADTSIKTIPYAADKTDAEPKLSFLDHAPRDRNQK